MVDILVPTRGVRYARLKQMIWKYQESSERIVLGMLMSKTCRKIKQQVQASQSPNFHLGAKPSIIYKCIFYL
jgi:hypothetical protein